jgi:hypothetical protein
MRNKNLFAAGLSAWLLVLAVGGWAPAARAATLNPAVIGMFPKNVGEFAYADLRQARQFTWFRQFQEQILPPRFRQFEQFLTSAGLNPNSEVEELAWALVPTTITANTNAALPAADQILGVALGQFNPSAAQAFFQSQKLATAQSHNETLYAFGSGSSASDLFFVFLDSNTAAFGQRSLLERLLQVRAGEEANLMSNTSLYPLISQANGQGIFWGALDAAYTRLAMNQLVPQATQFPQAGQLLDKMNALLISVNGSNSIQADFHAICTTAQDANTLAQLLQAGLLMERYQAGQNNPELGALLDSARVAPNSSTLDVSFSLTNDQVLSLIQRNTFGAKL